MGSTSYLNKSRGGYKSAKSGSSVCSDKEMNGKLRRTKIRRPVKMNEYGISRVPDYTDMAYKEAVGKLRYFLAGNYSPSVRSYGGSASIKNLDDEADKKYSSTITEYKPRPRLTAKYATLYADSLHNYGGKTTTAAQPAPLPTDVTSGTNPDVVHFIQKQEEYIEQLERESQYCRDELNTLLGKVKEVISENEHLHEAQQNKLISRMFQTYTAGSETDDLDELGDSTGLDSDNKTTPLKSKRSGKSRGVRLEGSSIVFESRIAELEAQLTQAKIDLKKLQDENNDNKRKLASGLVDSTCLDGFKRQIDNLQRDKSTLEAQVSKLRDALDRNEDTYKYKGSDVIEKQLRDERNKLEEELRLLKEELAMARSEGEEGARRSAVERGAAERRLLARRDQLERELHAEHDHAAKLQLELERQRREENDLKREISMKNAVVEELKMELKNRSSLLQADLSQAHAEKASLEEELASSRLALERHQRQAKHEANRLNSEIQSLRQRLDRADADLVHSRRENLRLAEQISTLEKELNMKNLTPMSPEKNKKELDHAKTVAELETMIQSQNKLMEKLTGECRLLTDKLDDANRRHKEELASLHRQVDHLGRSMQASAHDSYYQAPASHAPPAHGHVEPTSPPAPRQNHSRTVPSPLAQVRRQHSPTLPTASIERPGSRQLSRQTSKSSMNTTTKPEMIEPELQKSRYEVPERDIANESLHRENNPMEVVPSQNYQSDYSKEDEHNQDTIDYAQKEVDYNQDPTTYESKNNIQEPINYRQPAPNYAEPPQEEANYNEPATYGQVTEESINYNQDQGNYDQTQADYNQEQSNYEQTAYDQNYTTDPNYQNENYEQYPAQQYTEVEYPQNYEQNYTDPNARYDGSQYENYSTDPNYATKEQHDNQIYDSNNAFTAQAQNVTQQSEESKTGQEYVESKVTTSPVTNKNKS